MKEQLANMTIIELVRTGHSFATSIQHSETHSAIVREMASRLEALNIAYIRAMNIIRSAADDRTQQHGITFFSADELSAALARVKGLHEISVELIAEDVFKQHAVSPATDAWQREQIKKAIPEGYALVPQEMCLSAEAMEAICFHCGDGGFAFGEFTDGVLFVGDSEPEEGKKVHGLHIVTADYPEEGCAVICEFLPVPRNGEAS